MKQGSLIKSQPPHFSFIFSSPFSLLFYSTWLRCFSSSEIPAIHSIELRRKKKIQGHSHWKNNWTVVALSLKSHWCIKPKKNLHQILITLPLPTALLPVKPSFRWSTSFISLLRCQMSSWIRERKGARHREKGQRERWWWSFHCSLCIYLATDRKGESRLHVERQQT